MLLCEYQFTPLCFNQFVIKCILLDICLSNKEFYSNALGWHDFFLCLFFSTGFPRIEEGSKGNSVCDVEVVSGGLVIQIHIDKIEEGSELLCGLICLEDLFTYSAEKSSVCVIKTHCSMI